MLGAPYDAARLTLQRPTLSGLNGLPLGHNTHVNPLRSHLISIERVSAYTGFINVSRINLNVPIPPTTDMDLDQFSDSQRVALDTYTAVTNQELAAAVPLLERSQWKVQVY